MTLRRNLVVLCLATAATAGRAQTRIQVPDSVKARAIRRQAELDSTTGVLVGTLTDAQTGRPVRGAWLGTDYFGDGTDSAGHFRIIYLDPPSQTVTVWRQGYITEVRQVAIRAGHTDTLDISVRRAPLPCCSLQGRWSIAMHLASDNPRGPRPTRRDVTGTIQLADSFPDPMSSFRRANAPEDSLVREIHGRFAIDWSPFFGGVVSPDVSRSVWGGGESLLREASSAVFHGDSVTITLIPRMSHGSLSLSGRLIGDSITGRWVQNAYSSGATGTFRMVRTVPRTAP